MGKTIRKDGLPESCCRGNCKSCKNGKVNQQKKTHKIKEFDLEIKEDVNNHENKM